jgi:hypothetical protein
MADSTFKLCAQASYQIEAMCFALKSAARSQDAAISDALPLLVQSLAQRINDLSAAWILAQDGMDDDTADFERVLFGVNWEVSHG